MSLVNFFRGPKDRYIPSGVHKDAIYFAKDTKELLMNGDTYGDTISSITFSEVTSGNDKGKVFASIEFASGNKIENIDTGCYGREELDSQLSSTVSIVSETNSIVSGLVRELNILEGSSSTPGSVAYQIALIVAGADTSYDTLKEIADWILNDTTGAAKMASDIENLKTNKVNTSDMVIDPTNGFEYVDLGLPSGTLWATMNVGAESETDYGLLFAWGETEGHSSVKPVSDSYSYDWTTCPYNNGNSSYAATKYTGSDDKTILDAIDDAANVNWGGNWRMPTMAEWGELLSNCTGTWESSPVAGYRFTSKITNYTNKSIFLPAAGFGDNVSVLNSNTSVHNQGSSGRYWSSSLDENIPSRAWYLDFSLDDMFDSSTLRYVGHSVRPVIDGPITISPKYATKTELTELALQIGSDTALNDRITALTGLSTNTYSSTSSENGFIKNATNILNALNNLDNALVAMSSLLVWNDIVPKVYNRFINIDNDSIYVLTDIDGKILTIENSGTTYGIITPGNNNNGQRLISLASDYSDYATACGGSTAVTVTQFTDTANYTFTIDGDEYTVTNGVLSPNIIDWVN